MATFYMAIKYPLKAKRFILVFTFYIQVTVDGQRQTGKALIYIFIFKRYLQNFLLKIYFLKFAKLHKKIRLIRTRKSFL